MSSSLTVALCRWTASQDSGKRCLPGETSTLRTAQRWMIFTASSRAREAVVTREWRHESERPALFVPKPPLCSTPSEPQMHAGEAESVAHHELTTFAIEISAYIMLLSCSRLLDRPMRCKAARGKRVSRTFPYNARLVFVRVEEVLMMSETNSNMTGGTASDERRSAWGARLRDVGLIFLSSIRWRVA